MGPLHPLVLVFLAAAPGELKLAMPGLHLTDIPRERATFYTEELASEVITRGIRVVTEKEMGALLTLERQKEMLGCADSGCVVELANALGVDGLILGELARVGARYQGTLRTVDARTGAPLSVFTFKAASEEELVDALERAAAQFAVEVPKALGREVPKAAMRPAATTTSSGRLPVARKKWWAPALGGVLLIGGGVACLLASRADYATLDPSTPGRLGVEESQSIASRGSTLQVVSVVLFATGGVLAALAAVVGLFGSDVTAAVALVPGGAGLSLSGVFP